MTVIISGTNGITNVNGSAAAPAETGVDTDTGIFFPAANTLGFSTNGAEVARFDSSGNLGLGVTPSAWSGFTALQIQNGALFTDSTSFRSIMNGYYNGSNWIYSTTNAATRYEQVNGIHRWFNAPSGTAGNAITFTQAMTLDASGNLGIGTTSPSKKFVVSNGGAAGVELDPFTRSATTGASLLAYNRSGSAFVRMDYDAEQHLFFTSTAERARIDSSGNLLVGTTSALNNTSLGRINSQNTTLPSFVGAASSSSFTSSTLLLGSGTTAGTGFNHIACYVATGGSDQFATGVFFVRGNGNTVNTNNSYGAISDVKLKENIVDATPKLAQLNQVRIVNYNLIGSEQKQLGVIAQELEQIFPSMVDETVDRDTEGNDLGTTTKQVKYSIFVPMLIKALQEQQAIITQLQADVNSLKAQ